MSKSASDLPAGWGLVALPDVAAVIMGQSPPGSTYNTDEKGLPFFQGKAEFGADHPTARKWCTAPTRVAEPGDLLMSVRAPVGPTNVADQRCAVGRGLAIIRANEGVPTNLIRHALYLMEDEIATWGTGTTFSAISKEDFKRIVIALPPPRERDRMVKILDLGRARSRSALAHLRTGRGAIERFRRAVLTAACTGRLTDDWREAHPDASSEELLQKMAERREALLGPRAKPPSPIASQDLRSIPTSWRWASVDSLALRVVDGVHKTPTYREAGIPFVTVRNLTAGPGLSFDGARFISEEDHARFCMRAKPERGDLLISKDGTIGVTRAIRIDQPFSIFVSVALIKPVFQTMTDYLELSLSSPPVQEQMIGVGSGLQHLVLRDLKADGVPIPPPEEQTEIVRRASSLLAEASRVTDSIDRASRQLKRSQGALLAKAFRGELLKERNRPE